MLRYKYNYLMQGELVAAAAAARCMQPWPRPPCACMLQQLFSLHDDALVNGTVVLDDLLHLQQLLDASKLGRVL